jgi:hypothetical protein
MGACTPYDNRIHDSLTHCGRRNRPLSTITHAGVKDSLRIKRMKFISVKISNECGLDIHLMRSSGSNSGSNITVMQYLYIVGLMQQ